MHEHEEIMTAVSTAILQLYCQIIIFFLNIFYSDMYFWYFTLINLRIIITVLLL